MNFKSKHIFLFPFRWGEDEDSDNIEKKLIENNWKSINFAIEINSDYNQQIYFYKHIRDEIYPKENSSLFSCFEYNNSYNIYKIKIKNKKNHSLKIENISLKLYKKCRIGILSFKLANYDYHERKDILIINEYGRRIYPQYLPLDAVKDSFLAESITIEKSEKDRVSEDFKKKYKIQSIQKRENLFILPEFITPLLDPVFNNAEKIEPVIDDRMFTLCWYGNDKAFTEAKKKITEKTASLKNTFWYEYIFVDGNECTCQSKQMLQKHISEHTYDRWVEHGTLYGVSRYSFMVLTKNKPPDFIITHLETMYYEMIMLCLIQRASLISFRERIHNFISDKKRDQKSVAGLYEDYVEFKNRIYAREVTAQEQGIELYDMIQSVMRIDQEVSSLDNDVKELYNFTRLLGIDKSTQQMESINKIALVFAPLAIALGFFTLRGFQDSFLNTITFWVLCLLTIILTLLVIFINVLSIKIKRSNLIGIIAKIMTAVLAGFLIFFISRLFN